jgi:hypothetical protein
MWSPWVVEAVAEEEEAIGVAAGDGLGHGAERGIDAAGIGEAVGEHLYLHQLALVRTDEDGARRRQARIDGRQDADCLRRRRHRRVRFVGGRIESEVGVACQLGGAAAGALGEVAFGQGLHAPSDAFDEPGAVAGGGGFAEELGEALPQLGDAPALQGGDLVDDVQLHRVLLSVSGNGQPVWTVSLKSHRSSRPLETKKKDFLRREKWRDVLGFLRGCCA